MLLTTSALIQNEKVHSHNNVLESQEYKGEDGKMEGKNLGDRLPSS